MTTTLGLWQTVGLIALTVIAIGILRRVAILIVMVVSRRWFAVSHNAIQANDENRLLGNLSASHSDITTPWHTAFDINGGPGVPFTLQEPYEEHSTGASPGGVSFVPQEPVRKPLVSLRKPTESRVGAMLKAYRDG